MTIIRKRLTATTTGRDAKALKVKRVAESRAIQEKHSDVSQTNVEN